QVEALATHWSRAGEVRRAARAAAAAGQAAVEAFAFDRASSFYRLALAGTDDRQSAAVLGRALGDALANAGRRLDAARAYLDAARLSETQTAASELRRLAADELLRGGHIDEGIDVLDTVLAPIGLRLAKTPRGALASCLYQRAKLAVRGTKFTLRSRDAVAPDTLHRIDASWSVSSGLGLVDPIRGLDFQTRGLLLALDAGEPERISHGLAMDAAMIAAGGARNLPRVTDLLEQAEALLEPTSRPEWRAFLLVARGVVAFQYGRFTEANRYLTEAESILTEQCIGVPWLLARAQNFLVWQLAYVGRLREIRTRVSRTLDEYGARQDLFSTMALTLGPVHIVYLADDRVAAMRRDCEDLTARWSQRGFHFQHFSALFTLAAADLYEYEPARALERLDASQLELEGSMLLRSQFFRLDHAYLRGRAALLLAELDQQRRTSAVREVRQAVRTIENEGDTWGLGAARALRAGLARLDDDAPRAARELDAAEHAFRAAGMSLHAAAAALVRATLDGESREPGTEALRAEGVLDPERFARFLVPVLGR
ncbi:MAG TPA: hypothetical protein VNN72_06705, partial [Polyangiaceae bacterium]|nr:hypothetical protein [Polyangiaceae bacterium]